MRHARPNVEKTTAKKKSTRAAVTSKSRESGRAVKANPQTELGKRLRAIREEIKASGVKLLSLQEVRDQISKTRGHD